LELKKFDPQIDNNSHLAASPHSTESVYFNEFLGSGIFSVQHGVGAPDEGKSWMQMRKISAQVGEKLSDGWILRCRFFFSVRKTTPRK